MPAATGDPLDTVAGADPVVGAAAADVAAFVAAGVSVAVLPPHAARSDGTINARNAIAVRRRRRCEPATRTWSEPCGSNGCAHPLFPSGADYPFDHAGEGETGLMQAFRPESVAMERVDEGRHWYAETAHRATAARGEAGVQIALAHMRRCLGLD